MNRLRRSNAKQILCTLVGVAWALAAWPSLIGGTAHAVDFTSMFRHDDCTWSSKGTQNPFFSLKPRYQVVLEGEEEDDGETVEVKAEITVLRKTRRITFESASGKTISLRARVIKEREWEDGELIEESFNWFARCVETGDIYYFGEDVDIYEDGEIVSHDGAWLAGEDGAIPGIIMPGTFLLGSKYFQEVAPGVALDRARHVDMGLEVTTPAGTFTDCVAVLDSTPLDPDAEDLKFYCPGVGIAVDDILFITEFGQARP